MNIDQLVKDSINDVTGQVPAPDLDRIHQQGRRRSAVRVGGAALATLAVVAVGTYGVQSVGEHRGSDEVPVSIREQGAAAAFVTYAPTTAHVAGKTFQPEHKSSLEASAVTNAGLVYVSGDSRGTPYLLDRSGDETQLGDPVNPEGKRTWASQVVTNVARDTVAWSTDVPGPEIQINLFDVDAREVTDSITFDPGVIAEGSDTSWSGLDTVYGGTVYGTVDVGGAPISFAWDPSRPKGAQLYAATDSGTLISAVGTDRLVVEGKGDVYGGPDKEPLDPSVQVSRLPGKSPYRGVGVESATLSPDGRWALVDPDQVNEFGVRVGGPDADTFDDPSKDYAAMDLDTGTMLRFRSQGIAEARFDDDGSVLMIELTPDGGDRLIDCALPSLKCTTVQEDLPGKPGESSFID